MSHFYGTIQGSRGKATRCGTVKSGMTTQCASWSGAVLCHAWRNERTGTDMVGVSLIPWHGNGVLRTLYCGPIGEYKPEATS